MSLPKAGSFVTLSSIDGSLLWRRKSSSTWHPLMDGLIWEDFKRFDPCTGEVKGTSCVGYLAGRGCQSVAMTPYCCVGTAGEATSTCRRRRQAQGRPNQRHGAGRSGIPRRGAFPLRRHPRGVWRGRDSRQRDALQRAAQLPLRAGGDVWLPGRWAVRPLARDRGLREWPVRWRKVRLSEPSRRRPTAPTPGRAIGATRSDPPPRRVNSRRD